MVLGLRVWGWLEGIRVEAERFGFEVTGSIVVDSLYFFEVNGCRHTAQSSFFSS